MSVGWVSKRTGFRWLPSPFTETTSTLVLTTVSNHYVDIRLTTPTPSSSPSSPSSSPAVAAAAPKTLSWAFAGTLTRESTSTEGVAKGIWTHTIDSRTRHVVVDSGYLKDTIDENGNSQQLEYGQMMDEQVGKVRDYEEMWEDKRVDQDPMVVMVLGKLDDNDDESERKSEDGDVKSGKESRGMLIYLGGWLQMVQRTSDDKIVAERWSVSEKTGGEAKCVWCTGDGAESAIGGKVVQDMKGFKEGQRVTYGTDVWIVKECSL